jgi:hypothetical protein
MSNLSPTVAAAVECLKAIKQADAGPKELVAADLLNSKHPLNGAFSKWVKQRNEATGNNTPPSKRQARKFLAKFPNFRNRVSVAA